MYKWGLLLCFLFCVDSNDAVKCYGCIASTKSDCYEGKLDSYFLQDCDAAMNATNEADIENVCIQFTLLEPVFDQKVAERGCGFIWKGVDICKYLSTIAKVEDCSSCSTDYCNSGKISSNQV